MVGGGGGELVGSIFFGGGGAVIDYHSNITNINVSITDF